MIHTILSLLGLYLLILRIPTPIRRAIFSEHELIKKKPIYRSLRSVDEKIIENTSQLRISLGQMKSD
ncbi:hypothetical protein RCL_jg8165.t1 [Rhizophagus clarus]|uniref:Uncharacterized protein n=1 Tax=Rhizophagus clarus TaxID=94130 RepID=A0A8H3MEU0_9GLOM|nr:hypothetical protein RCL_jg8165.t1 [Rhizophagus clarus]